MIEWCPSYATVNGQLFLLFFFYICVWRICLHCSLSQHELHLKFHLIQTIQLSCKLAFAPSSGVNMEPSTDSTQGNALLLLPGLLCSTLLRTSGDSNLIHFTMGSFVAEKTSFTMRTARLRVLKQWGHYCPILRVVPRAIALCVTRPVSAYVLLDNIMRQVTDCVPDEGVGTVYRLCFFILLLLPLDVKLLICNCGIQPDSH